MSCMRMVHVEDCAISNWHWTMPSTMELTQPACHGRVSLALPQATRDVCQLQQKMDWSHKRRARARARVEWDGSLQLRRAATLKQSRGAWVSHGGSHCTMVALRALALVLTGAAGAEAWWREEDTKTRGAAPYPYPASHKDGTAPVYNVRQLPVLPPSSLHWGAHGRPRAVYRLRHRRRCFTPHHHHRMTGGQ